MYLLIDIAYLSKRTVTKCIYIFVHPKPSAVPRTITHIFLSVSFSLLSDITPLLSTPFPHPKPSSTSPQFPSNWDAEWGIVYHLTKRQVWTIFFIYIYISLFLPPLYPHHTPTTIYPISSPQTLALFMPTSPQFLSYRDTEWGIVHHFTEGQV